MTKWKNDLTLKEVITVNNLKANLEMEEEVDSIAQNQVLVALVQMVIRLKSIWSITCLEQESCL